jgi:hypothetical protein
MTVSILLLPPYTHTTYFMLSLYIYPEDGGSRFLQNVDNNFQDCMGSDPR